MNRQLLSIAGFFLVGAVTIWLVLLTRTTADEMNLELPPKVVAELSPPRYGPGDWPWWRGPSRDGRSGEPSGPIEWGESKNVVWKTPIPGRGHSTPIVLGDRMFLTAADEDSQKQMVVGLDRATGEVLWQTVVHEGKFPPIHPDNSHASGSPATDGDRVFAVFANDKAIHVTALGTDGKLIWTRVAGPHGGESCWGSGASPAVWSNLVFISDESPGKGWIAALHRESGEIAWRKERKATMGSYGSPTLGELDGKTRLVLAGNGTISVYEPTTGELLWETAGMAEAIANTPAVAENMVFSSSGYPQRKLLAVKSDGTVAWKKESGNEIPYPPSMVIHKGSLFAASDQGLVSCFDARTGKQRWKERLPPCYASPLLVGDTVYVCSRDGTTTVFDANPKEFSPLATNKLEGSINASPIVAGGRLYIRTDSHLYCIGSN